MRLLGIICINLVIFAGGGGVLKRILVLDGGGCTIIPIDPPTSKLPYFTCFCIHPYYILKHLIFCVTLNLPNDPCLAVFFFLERVEHLAIWMDLDERLWETCLGSEFFKVFEGEMCKTRAQWARYTDGYRRRCNMIYILIACK